MMSKINIVLDDGAIMPTKAHQWDAGFDLYSPIDAEILPDTPAVIDTGVHIEIPAGYAGLVVAKSGLNVKHNILSTGLIDSGYTGSIVIKLYNHSMYDMYQVKKGDKISQLVIIPTPLFELVQAESLADTERGNGGFGSTGR